MEKLVLLYLTEIEKAKARGSRFVPYIPMPMDGLTTQGLRAILAILRPGLVVQPVYVPGGWCLGWRV